MLREHALLPDGPAIPSEDPAGGVVLIPARSRGRAQARGEHPGVAHPALRRLVDIVACSIILIAALPLLVLIVIAIALESPGNVLFLQTRVGENGRPFRIWKFRSMAAGNSGPLVSGAGDPRITGTGHLLRTTKLDELPQIWNILRGEMTIVGPRPEVPEMVAHYTAQDREVLAFRPGMAGPGQIVFTEDQAPALDTAEDPDDLYIRSLMRPRIATDIAYFGTRTLWSDVVLLAQTFALLVRETSSSLAGMVRRPVREEFAEDAEEEWIEPGVTVAVIDVTGTVSEPVPS